MIRIVAVLGNIAVIGLIIYELVKNGIPSDKAGFYLSGLFIITALTSLLTITLQNPNSWIGLYFKRKALEEQAKISKLTSKP